MIKPISLKCSVFACAVTMALAVSMLEAQTPQTRLRVVRDRAIVWHRGFTTMAGMVTAGTELTVVARRGNWFEVVLPPNLITSGRTGMIAASQVELIEGAAPPDSGSPALRPPGSPPNDQQGSSRSRAPASSSSRYRGFGQFGYGRFNAHQTFDAVLGTGFGPWFGGGVEYVFTDRLFAQGSVDLFRRTGERVFVFDGTVFKLGIPDTVTLTPLRLTAGYRFARRGLVPYAAGGIGRYFLWEESPLGEPADKVKQQITSYHLIGGVEVHKSEWITTAVEVQYSHLPNSLSSDLSTIFNEHNLGGTEVRIKFVVGK